MYSMYNRKRLRALRVADPVWIEFKKLAAENQVALGDMLKILIDNYKIYKIKTI